MFHPYVMAFGRALWAGVAVLAIAAQAGAPIHPVAHSGYMIAVD